MKKKKMEKYKKKQSYLPGLRDFRDFFFRSIPIILKNAIYLKAKINARQSSLFYSLFKMSNRNLFPIGLKTFYLFNKI